MMAIAQHEKRWYRIGSRQYRADGDPEERDDGS
jgi:hypothetical protein